MYKILLCVYSVNVYIHYRRQHMQAMCWSIGNETGGQERVFHDVLMYLAMQDQCE